MTEPTELEPIEPRYAEKLSAAGVRTMERFLSIGSSRRGRQTIAMTTGISEKLVAAWINRADLTRIDGLSHSHSSMLEQAGVKGVPELATTNAQTLHLKLQALQDQGTLNASAPPLTEIEQWIAKAKALPRKIEH